MSEGVVGVEEVVEAASSSGDTMSVPVVVDEVQLQKNVGKVVDESGEPLAKRRKVGRGGSEDDKASERLEYRLGGILCCTVCLDLPKAAVYQCSNGHLMCAGCFTHVLADARLRDECATCPNCRVDISRELASRNLAVENAISELPSECQFCSKEFSRNIMERHQESQCEERIVTCDYKCIGCPWRGPYHESGPHQLACTHPLKSASEVVTAAQGIEKARCNTQKMLDNIFNLLGYEKITFNDLQFKPYRTEEYVNKLFYETSRFAAFNHVWVVKANINNSQRDPTQSSERDITYQVILKSRTTTPLPVQYVILRGPFGDMRTSARIYQFDFTERDTESTPSALPLPDSYECNRLLANKTINFRLIMFLASK